MLYAASNITTREDVKVEERRKTAAAEQKKAIDAKKAAEDAKRAKQEENENMYCDAEGNFSVEQWLINRASRPISNTVGKMLSRGLDDLSQVEREKLRSSRAHAGIKCGKCGTVGYFYEVCE